MNRKKTIELAEALLGLPGKRPGQYEDVTKLARIGTLAGLSGGFWAATGGGGFLAFCVVTFAGSLSGGGVALLLRRLGVSFPRLAKAKRENEIAGCVAGALLTILCAVVSVWRPNILTIFGVFFFGWGTVRYFHRQQALAPLAQSSKSPE